MERMKAITIDGYGEAGNLSMRDLPDPQLGDEEILVGASSRRKP